MKRGTKVALLGAAVMSAIAASQARASFTYSLQFAPTGNPAGAVISADGKTAALTPGATGTYTLQLWGIITADSTVSNDIWTSGVVSIGSSAGGASNALVGGGITSAQASSNFGSTDRVGVANEFTSDGIGDWGSNSTANGFGTKWMHWQNTNANTNPVVPGFQPTAVVPGLIQQVPGDPNSFEALIATFTVNVAALVAQDNSDHQTIFSLLSIPANVAKSSVLKDTGLIFYQNGTDVQQGTPNASSVPYSTGTGVTFDLAANVPEPASLGVLAVGALGLLARRKRA